MQGLAILMAIGGFVCTVVWVCIGWRSMVALERIAGLLDAMDDRQRRHPDGDRYA
jgi:hypothetical protein